MHTRNSTAGYGAITVVLPASAQAVRPYSIGAVAPIPQPSVSERWRAAEAAGFNVSCLDPSEVAIDLRTDSASSPLLGTQLATLVSGLRAPESPRSRFEVAASMGRVLGKRHVVLFAQGRAAEAALIDVLSLTEATVLTNAIFPSTRFHLGRRGCRVIECSHPDAQEWSEPHPFKGNLDVQRCREVMGERKVKAVWLELASNGCFGQPLSLSCLRAITDTAAASRLPTYVDATRCLENAVLVREREAPDESVATIVAASVRIAHAVTGSCLKSFQADCGGFVATDDDDLAAVLEDAAIARGDGLSSAMTESLRLGIELATQEAFATDRARQPRILYRLLDEAGLPVVRPAAAHGVFLDANRFLPQLPNDRSPAKALALALYLQSGIRIDEHFVPECFAPRQAVRLAVPARRYFDDQMQWVAQEVARLYAERDRVQGLVKLADGAGLASSLRARFDPVG